MGDSDLPYHIVVSYDPKLPSIVAEEFTSRLLHTGLRYASEARPDRGPVAGLQWLLPTGIQ